MLNSYCASEFSMYIQYIKPIKMSTKYTLHQKTCPCCSGLVIGRSDKIFCSIQCKNIHHNAARSQLNLQIQQCQKMIQRNLIVLEGILGHEHNEMTIHKDTLFHYGFNLQSCTSVTRVGKKTIYHLGNYNYTICADGTIEVRRQGLKVEKYDLFFNRWLIDFPVDLGIESTLLTERVKLNMINFERRNKVE